MTDVDDSFRTFPKLAPGEQPPTAVCPHDREPLVSTFEFRGAEFYCVVCRRKYGFMAPLPAPSTPELDARLRELTALYDRERSERKAAGL